MRPVLLIACASPPISGNGNPGRVPGRRGSSRIVPASHTKGCACPSAATLVPTTWPPLFSARGVVEFPPSVPRSIASAGFGADTACALGRRGDTADGSVQAASDASTAAGSTRPFMGLLREGVGCPSSGASQVPAIVTPGARDGPQEG